VLTGDKTLVQVEGKELASGEAVRGDQILKPGAGVYAL
jgi:hypothetical protein